MRRIATGTRPFPGQPDVIQVTITVDPAPEATPADFVQQLHGIGETEQLLAGAEVSGSQVVVTLVDFGLTKWILQQTGKLPEFAALLPED
jgi:hypothetical protein